MQPDEMDALLAMGERGETRRGEGESRALPEGTGRIGIQSQREDFQTSQRPRLL